MGLRLRGGGNVWLVLVFLSLQKEHLGWVLDLQEKDFATNDDNSKDTQ